VGIKENLMSKKRDRHLLALESEEREHQIELQRKKHERRKARLGLIQFRDEMGEDRGGVWILLRNFVLAPLVLMMIVFLAKACFGG